MMMTPVVGDNHGEAWIRAELPSRTARTGGKWRSGEAGQAEFAVEYAEDQAEEEEKSHRVRRVNSPCRCGHVTRRDSTSGDAFSQRGCA